MYILYMLTEKDVQQATLPAGTVITALWRMGDTTNDVTSPAADISH